MLAKETNQTRIPNPEILTHQVLITCAQHQCGPTSPTFETFVILLGAEVK